MLQYLIILLDDTSTSYCQCDNNNHVKNLISIENLKAGIFYGMKENLMIQFVYPDYPLPQEYKDMINTIDHNDIVSSRCEDISLIRNADVVVFHDWKAILDAVLDEMKIYTLRTAKDALFDRYKFLGDIIQKTKRLNIVINDIDKFTSSDFDKYDTMLQYLSTIVKDGYAQGMSPNLNLLTDRMMLEKMNNCNAGVENITLAPDGNFYVCPAFYYVGLCDGKEKSLGEECQKGYFVGALSEGLDLKNPQLYQLRHAPLCRNCDAYQCKRCVWLNRKTTLEINTPSHEQCVVAHLERNASKRLLEDIQALGTFLPNQEIKEIDYLDPFDIRTRFK